jgi:hypothetical protein
MSSFQKGLRLYWRQSLVQHHVNNEMCTVSVVFPLFCSTPVQVYYILRSRCKSGTCQLYRYVSRSVIAYRFRKWAGTWLFHHRTMAVTFSGGVVRDERHQLNNSTRLNDRAASACTHVRKHTYSRAKVISSQWHFQGQSHFRHVNYL